MVWLFQIVSIVTRCITHVKANRTSLDTFISLFGGNHHFLSTWANTRVVGESPRASDEDPRDKGAPAGEATDRGGASVARGKAGLVQSIP